MSTRTSGTSLWRLGRYSAFAGLVSLIQDRKHQGIPSRSSSGGVGAAARSPATAAASRSTRSETAVVDRRWWAPFKEAAVQWSEHKDARSGAALAYYSVFSIGP